VRITPTTLPGVQIIEPHVFRDDRGFFLETYQASRFSAAGLPAAFVQDNYSRSLGGTLRGLHWQWRRPQAKLVRVVAGEIFDVAVDIRRGSQTFGRWVGVRLSAENLRQTFIPEGFAHGFCVMSDLADVEYKCTAEYDAGGESGLPWDDPAIGIAWPVSTPILSVKDTRHVPLDRHERDLPRLSPTGELLWLPESRGRSS
jgi:dTDP-4-dehydrorhamnose 3,5-epimerase